MACAARAWQARTLEAIWWHRTGGELFQFPRITAVRSLCIFGLALVVGCAVAPVDMRPDDEYSVSSNCLADAARESTMQLPIGAGVASVNLGSRYDPGAYAACMVTAGHAPAGVDAEKLLSMAQICLGESTRSSDPKASYRACEQRVTGAVTIEEVPKARPR